MPETTFLAKFVVTRGLQAEPVATSLLTHILVTSEPARRALQDLVSTIHPDGAFEGMDFTEQPAADTGEGRPDIVGSLGTGRVLLIEAKFDAGLTAAQAGDGYVTGLAPGGLLLFLVPRDRVDIIWPELLVGPAGLPRNQVNPSHQVPVPGSPWRQHKLGDGRVVAVTSWQELLSRLQSATAATAAESDMNQLAGLVRTRVADGWVPVTGDDLAPGIGRRLTRLRDAVLQAGTEVSDGKGGSGNNEFGPARWILDDVGQRIFWAGLRLPTWAEFGISPLWAVFHSRDPVRRKAAKDALSPLQEEGGPGVYEVDKQTVGVPLRVPLGEEFEVVRSQLIEQMRRIRQLLTDGNANSDADDSTAT